MAINTYWYLLQESKFSTTKVFTKNVNILQPVCVSGVQVLAQYIANGGVNTADNSL